MNDWRDALAGFLADNPDLPAGSDAAAEAEPERELPVIEIVLDKKGRKGKPATIACGFDVEQKESVEELASALKQKLACGGSVRGGEILIQGDRREDVARELRSRGYKVKMC